MEPNGSQSPQQRPQTPLPRSNYLEQPITSPVPEPIVTPTPNPDAAPITPPVVQPPVVPAAIGSQAMQQTVDTPDMIPTPAVNTWEPPEQFKPKTKFWQTQRFWIIAVSILFVLLAITGSVLAYMGTHHKPDTTIPGGTPNPPVDTSSKITTVGSTSAEKAANTQRQSDILSIRSYVEAYFTANNHYPSTANMTNPAWVTANLKGLDPSVLKDPSGTTSSLAGQPTKNQYAYQAGNDRTMGACDNATIDCNYYKLTATLSDGSLYVKTALQ